jgi:hypothetical protein
MPILFLVRLRPAQRRFLRRMLKVILLLVLAAGLFYMLFMLHVVSKKLNHAHNVACFYAQLNSGKEFL